MARNAAAAACSAAVLLLAVSVYATGDTTGPRTAVQAPDLAAGVEETSSLLPVHHNGDKEVEEDIKAGRRRVASAGDVASLATAGEEGKEVGSDWGEPKKRDDKNDSDSDSDDDSGSDLDSDSDSDSDSDDEEDHSSKKGSKKHPAPWRNGASGGQHDDKQPEMVIKI